MTTETPTSALEHVWADYKAANPGLINVPFTSRPRDDDWAERLAAAAIADHGKFEDYTHEDGEVIRYAVLTYTVDPEPYWVPDTKRWAYTLTTEPCPFCGKRHHHGAGYDRDGDGHRAGHCETHTHDLTPTGRRRSIWAKRTYICPGCDGDGYVLKKDP